MNLVGILQKKLAQTPNDSDIDGKIARYLLVHLNAPALSIAQIAEGCFTSTSTIRRFFKGIGYATFREFQLDHQAYFVDREEMRADWQANKTRDLLKDGDFIKHEMDLILNDLSCYHHEINLNEIDYLCDLIHQKERIHLYATHIPGNMAMIIQYCLLTAGKIVDFYPLLQEQLQLAKQLTRDDLAIFISLEGSHVMAKNLTLTITESDAYSLLITQNPTLKLSSRFDQIICLGSHSREESGKYKLLFFVEALIHHYFAKYVH